MLHTSLPKSCPALIIAGERDREREIDGERSSDIEHMSQYRELGQRKKGEI